MNWHIYGIVGSGKHKEEVFLEKHIKFEDVEYLLQRWNSKKGMLWEVIQMNMNGAKRYSECPSCGNENENVIAKIQDDKMKPLDYHFVPYVDDFCGSGYMTIRCEKCRQVFNLDIST